MLLRQRDLRRLRGLPRVGDIGQLLKIYEMVTVLLPCTNPFLTV